LPEIFVEQRGFTLLIQVFYHDLIGAAADGNGQVSRIMMNVELVKAGRTRIIVPTVFREDYLLSLRRFSRNNDPSVYIRVMEKLQLFSSYIVGDNFDDAYRFLKESDAFEDPETGPAMQSPFKIGSNH
jgi:hypothetical protein